MQAAYSAAASVGIVFGMGVLAGSIRILPFVFAEGVPLSTVFPFARSVLTAGLEVAVLVGVPLGVALSVGRLVERGDARVFELLGERPVRTLSRLSPILFFFGPLLYAVSYAAGHDAVLPGKVLSQLVLETGHACERGSRPAVLSVPLFRARWVCFREGEGPSRILVSPSDGPLEVAGRSIQIAADLRQIALEDASFFLRSRRDAKADVLVRVGRLDVGGLPPFTRRGSMPRLRALALAAAGLLSLLAASAFVLAFRLRDRLRPFALGLAGPLASLAVLRILEERNAGPAGFVLVGVAALVAVLAVGGIAGRLPRLRDAART